MTERKDEEIDEDIDLMCAAIGEMAKRVRMTFVPDPEKIGVIRVVMTLRERSEEPTR